MAVLALFFGKAFPNGAAATSGTFTSALTMCFSGHNNPPTCCALLPCSLQVFCSQHVLTDSVMHFLKHPFIAALLIRSTSCLGCLLPPMCGAIAPDIALLDLLDPGIIYDTRVRPTITFEPSLRTATNLMYTYVRDSMAFYWSAAPNCYASFVYLSKALL